MDPARRHLLATGALAIACGPQARAAEAPDVALNLRAVATAAGRLSYDDTPAGPVVRLPRGSALAVTLTNALAEATSLQWHGLRGPGAAIGDPPASLAPGETARFRVMPPDSGLLWFHPSALPGHADQTAAGLHGVVVVEESSPPVADRDLVVVVADGADTPLVNGVPEPLRETLVTGGRLRLRVLNASTARIMILAIEGARPKIVAIDGQPSDLFEPVRASVPVGPGARFEFLMDAPRAEGTPVRLWLRGTGFGDGPAAPDTLLLECVTTGAPREPLPPIAALPRNPALPPAIALERAARADCVIEAVPGAIPGAARWRLNGTAALDPPARPLLTVPRGGAVTLGFANRSAVPVPIRVHGHAMRLLHARDDGWEPYWRDSVILPPASVNHVAFVADAPGRWLIDSAMFDQTGAGLRTWFEVT